METPLPIAGGNLAAAMDELVAQRAAEIMPQYLAALAQVVRKLNESADQSAAAKLRIIFPQ